MGKGGKKERKALKDANKKASEAKKASKAEIRKEISDRNTDLKGGLSFNHHCPHKEQARTHAINNNCIKKGHVGYCPNCFNLVSWLYGCSVCKYKRDELETKRPTNFVDVINDRKSKGLLGPRGLDARTATEAAEEEEEEEEPLEDGDAADAQAEEDERVIAEIERELAQQNLNAREGEGQAGQPIQPQVEPPRQRRRRVNEP